MKSCKDCLFFMDGFCGACCIPTDSAGEPCDKFHDKEYMYSKPEAKSNED